MSARNYIVTIGAGATVSLPAGRYFYVKAATSGIDVVAKRQGQINTFSNIGAGAKFGPVSEGQGWRFLDVTSASAQIVEIIISDDGNFEIAASVTVAGGVTTTEQPSATLTTSADIAIAATTTDILSIPQNLARRRITVGVLSTAAGAVRASKTGVTLAGVEIQPGTFVEFKTTAAIGIRNDGAAPTSFYFFEEA